MSGRLTFICVLEANLALSFIPSARRWMLRPFIPKWTVRRSAFLSKTGWSWGCVSALDSDGRTMWIAGAHRDKKRFVVRAGEILPAFSELERAICLHLLLKVWSGPVGPLSLKDLRALSRRAQVASGRKPSDLEKGTSAYRNGNSSVTFFSRPSRHSGCVLCKRLRNIPVLNRTASAAFQS